SWQGLEFFQGRRGRNPHERGAVDHAAGQDRGELGLGPANDGDGRAGEQQPGGGCSPDDLVDQAVGAVGGICNAVAVQVEGGQVGPVVASPGLRPFEIAGADVLHLVLVADEGVAVDAVAFGTGVVDADAAVLEMVVGQL